MTPEAQQKLLPVLQRPTMFRRMSTKTIDCDAEIFTFVVRRPEVLVGIWETMGVSKVKTQRLGTYLLDGKDAAGTNCRMELIYGTPSIHIYFATGSYDGPLSAQTLTGRGVFVLHSNHGQNQVGRSLVACKMDVFLQLDQLGIDLLARTLQPIVWSTAEQNFTESARYISQISLAAENNPAGMSELARKLPQVDGEVRQQFEQVIDRVALRAEARWTR
jgi:hypothetical protein